VRQRRVRPEEIHPPLVLLEQFDAVRLSARYPSGAGIEDVSFTVRRGEFVVVTGPVGSGKSTMLRAMLGLAWQAEISGIVCWNGEPIDDPGSFLVPPNAAFLPQVPQLISDSLADNIGFGLRERKVPKQGIAERVAEMLSLVELPEHGSRKPRQLSGGQQQRVALARSLVVEPTVLLLDEPLGALDLKLRKQMQIELKHIQQRVGITFIYVTHDQEEALTMSDTVVVMNNGRVEQAGSAEEIFERPRTRFVAGFMGAQVLKADIVGQDATSARIRIGQGQAQVTVGQGLPETMGGVAVVVRPEKVRLDVADGWPATVRNRVYKGSVMSYHLALDDGTALTADVAHDEPGHRHEVGDAVTIGFRPDDLVVIPDDGTGA